MIRDTAILTWVPSFSFVRSRVVPDGTVMPDTTIVAQDFFEALTAEAAVNIHDARFSRRSPISGAGVGKGTALGSATGAGTAAASAENPARMLRNVDENMLVNMDKVKKI